MIIQTLACRFHRQPSWLSCEELLFHTSGRILSKSLWEILLYFWRCVQSFSYMWTTHPTFTANLSKLGEFLGDFHEFQEKHIFMTIRFDPQLLAYLKKRLEFHKCLVLLWQTLPFYKPSYFLLYLFSLHRFSLLYSVHVLSPPFNFQHRLFLYPLF